MNKEKDGSYYKLGGDRDFESRNFHTAYVRYTRAIIN